MINDGVVINVTNYYYPTIGGISTYVHSLKIGLLKKRFNTEVIQFPEKFRSLEKKQINRYLKELLHFFFIIFFILYAELFILRLRLMTKNVIINSHSASFCLLIAVISKLFGCKAVHTFHSPTNKKSMLLHSLSPYADALVFVSNDLRNQYREISNVRNRREFIIPGCVDGELYYTRTNYEISKIRKQYSNIVGDQEKIVLFVGRVVEDKGILPLVKSIAIAGKQMENIKLIVAGPNNKTREQIETYSKAQDVIQQFNLKNSVYFINNADPQTIQNLYAFCDIFVSPSTWREPSSLVVVEAMASGKPVIVSNMGGLPERVINGKTGYIVAVNNPEELAEKIVYLLLNDNIREEMGQNAYNLFRQSYQIDSMVQKYEIIYNKIFN